MIRIYTDRSLLDISKVIIDNEGFFVRKGVYFNLSAEQVQAIKRIDGAIFLNEKQTTMQTPFGVTNIGNLSTGCKTVLNYLYLKQHPIEREKVQAISLIECGANALNVLFDLVDDDMIFLLEHRDGIHECTEHEFIINDTLKINSLMMM